MNHSITIFFFANYWTLKNTNKSLAIQHIYLQLEEYTAQIKEQK